jgi:hypothetical protein
LHIKYQEQNVGPKNLQAKIVVMESSSKTFKKTLLSQEVRNGAQISLDKFWCIIEAM